MLHVLDPSVVGGRKAREQDEVWLILLQGTPSHDSYPALQ